MVLTFLDSMYCFEIGKIEYTVSFKSYLEMTSSRTDVS